MRKNYFFPLFVLLCVAGKTFGQVYPCYTDEVRKRLIAQKPEILKAEAVLESEIKNGLSKIDYTKAARTTSVDQSGNPDFWYDVPIVIHIIHNYGAENLLDDSLINDLKDWNIVYSKQNWDTDNVIPTYAGKIPGTNVPYIGNIHIRLHLATIDPNGNPTKGITRHRSYLTYIGADQSKLDDWPNTSYVNIWSVNNMGVGEAVAAAYAYEPPEAASFPEGDGIIAIASYVNDAYFGYQGSPVSKTIPHEMGHVFNLYHPWGNTNNPEMGCDQGGDMVDDTPPTTGHLFQGCAYDHTALYDTTCAFNYFVIYTNISGGDSLVKYPDTVNSQNIMDYTYCARMFTYGQAARMHAALNSSVGGRNNLWDSTNLAITGALAPTPDLKPIPEFSAMVNSGLPNISDYQGHLYYFVFPSASSPVILNNETWNDTVTAVNWTFDPSLSPSPATSTSMTNVSVTFGNSPGKWADIKLTATGNNTGDTTVDFQRSIFVPSSTATPGLGYYEEFGEADTAQWPMFNYYNNEFHWQYANVGYDDNNSVMYTGYDSRINLTDFTFPYTGTPQGDVDDMFSIPLDLTGFSGGSTSLNFYYSGANRSSNVLDYTDTLLIQYATNKDNVWYTLDTLAGTKLCNKGAVGSPWIPSQQSDWNLFSVNLPAGAITPYTVFRFRYKPNPAVEEYSADGTTYIFTPGPYSYGNNFYMDRFTISPWPAGVGEVKLADMDATVVPNPTTGDAYVVIKDLDNANAEVVVTDITGKMIYTTSQTVVNSEARILIPHSYISVAGMYLVQITTGNQEHTQKLVVE